MSCAQQNVTTTHRWHWPILRWHLPSNLHPKSCLRATFNFEEEATVRHTTGCLQGPTCNLLRYDFFPKKMPSNALTSQKSSKSGQVVFLLVVNQPFSVPQLINRTMGTIVPCHIAAMFKAFSRHNPTSISHKTSVPNSPCIHSPPQVSPIPWLSRDSRLMMLWR